jgi:surface protein
MGHLFAGANAFNRPLGGWDTANVTDMQHVFDNAIEFNQDISARSTSKVTDMSNMFMNARKFNQSAIGKWDTAKVAYMDYMFDEAFAFEGKICWPHNDTVPTQRSMWTGTVVGNWTCP